MSQVKAVQKRIVVDFVLIFIFVILAIIFSKIGLIKDTIDYFSNWPILSVFVSGLFFTSAFTTAFAIAFFLELGGAVNIFLIALMGAFGAVIGDFILFYFIKDRFSDDVMFMVGSSGRKLRNIFKTKLFKIFSPFVAGLIIASPFPDELGISLLGFGKAKTITFLLFSFFANFIGIMFIVGFGQVF
jgi:hypothetical protein